MKYSKISFFTYNSCYNWNCYNVIIVYNNYNKENQYEMTNDSKNQLISLKYFFNQGSSLINSSIFYHNHNKEKLTKSGSRFSLRIYFLFFQNDLPRFFRSRLHLKTFESKLQRQKINEEINFDLINTSWRKIIYIF